MSNQSTVVNKAGSIAYESCTLLQGFPLRHGVTQRYGGISEGPYESLNLAFHVGDNKEVVLENRKRFAEHVLGVGIERLTCGEQVHSLHVAQVTEFMVGKGALSWEDGILQTDALHTNVVGVPLIILVADCVPVLLYDEEHHAVGVIHAGWRGAIGHLPSLTLQSMIEAYGTDPRHCTAYIGPSIGGASFEVGPEVVQEFRHDLYERHMSDEGIIRFVTTYGGGAETFEQGKAHIDLRAYIEQMLRADGVERIGISQVDTMTDQDYFSYRRDEGTTGRIGLFAMLEKSK